jgi:hypothetical protein
MLVGDVAVVPSGTTHDIAADDAFGAKLFTQTFGDVRVLDAAGDPSLVVYDLATHLREAKEDLQASPTRGIALANHALTAAELQDLQRNL